MSQSTRILICRLGFVLFCILPTTVVAGWIVKLRTIEPAASKAEWERELTSRLGLDVQIGDVAYPAADIARLSAVKLIDPASELAVAEAAVIEVAKTSSGWTVDAAGFALEARSLRALWRTINQRLLASQKQINVRWLPRHVLLKHGSATGQTLGQLTAAVKGDEAGNRCELQFQLPGKGQASEPIRIVVTRASGQRPGAWQWRLDTGGHSVPCSLLTDLWPELAGLGHECEFRGDAVVSNDAADLQIEMSGSFVNVDLDALVTERFPHQLSGTGNITIERAVFTGGKLTEVRGTLSAEQGIISPSLLAATAEHLAVQASPDVADIASAKPVAFSKLAIGFELSGAWLSLAGQADPEQPGALLIAGGRPLLTATNDHAVTSAGLLRTLLPDSQHQVPATRQTAALVRLLPLPDVVPGARAVPSHTPTRLAPAGAQSEAAVRQPVVR